jgi:hypothetical protein
MPSFFRSPLRWHLHFSNFIWYWIMNACGAFCMVRLHRSERRCRSALDYRRPLPRLSSRYHQNFCYQDQALAGGCASLDSKTFGGIP